MTGKLPRMFNEPGRKRSWIDLISTVKTSRSLHSRRSIRTPNNFTFSDSKLYFLALPENRSEYTLFYVDLRQGENGNRTAGRVEVPTWHLLLDLDSLGPFQGFSREEQLLRERKRMGSFGITSYEYDKNSRSILFPACSSLYMCKDHVLPSHPGDSNVPLVPGEVRSQIKESRMDPKLSPANPNVIAFIHHKDVWVSNVNTGCEKRLTWTHSGLPQNTGVEEAISAGVPSFVVQEEFDRYTGYWWQPIVENNNKFCILYEEVDESEVEILTMTPSMEATAPATVESYRYPRAGTQNAISCLKLVEFTLNDNGKFNEETTIYNLKVSLHEVFPWLEYIVRCGWLPDGKSIWAQLLDRAQQRLALIVIPLSIFVPQQSEASMDYDEAMIPQETIKIIINESTDVWINVCDILHFFMSPPDQSHLIKFIWTSEMSGFRHLYFVDVDCSHGNHTNGVFSEHRASFRQFTSGNWEVDGNKLWLDERKGVVYFMGTRDKPVEQHLYAAWYSSPSRKPERLTQIGFHHNVTMNEDCSLFVSVYSSVKDLPSVTVFAINHSKGLLTFTPSIMATPCFHIKAPGQQNESLCPELISFKSPKHGHVVHGMIFKPPGDFDVAQKYPTVLFVYGGPSVQIVSNSHKGIQFLRLQTIAMAGYLVVAFDCRGSFHRGKEFEGHLKNNLGCVEIEDQVEALHHVAKTTHKYIDLSRVAIHGWSYGGYLSLQGLAQRPDVFKVAVAGAPVTDWEAYDTGYTERYMNTPQTNPNAYSRSSVLNRVKDFPDQENRLLIVHGLIDENVHFHHTSSLIDRLIRAGKPYRLQIYPSERHGIRQPGASEHYEATVLSFLEHNL